MVDHVPVEVFSRYFRSLTSASKYAIPGRLVCGLMAISTSKLPAFPISSTKEENQEVYIFVE